MKRILKGVEPDFFTEWKNATIPTWSENPKDWDWGELKNPEKDRLREILFEEQGFICCYCNRGLQGILTKMEHFFPKQADKYPSKMFDYDNLLIACHGGEKDLRPRFLYCDATKGDKEPPLISPLQTDCESYFHFTTTGNIKAKNNDANSVSTIALLNLNNQKLIELRRTAIDTYIEICMEDTQTDEEFEQNMRGVVEDLKQRQDGKFAPFCTAVIGAFQYYLNP
ncbi:MAG: retron system putative HNH endonuclease [Chitinophagales bacterium]